MKDKIKSKYDKEVNTYLIKNIKETMFEERLSRALGPLIEKLMRGKYG